MDIAYKSGDRIRPFVGDTDPDEVARHARTVEADTDLLAKRGQEGMDEILVVGYNDGPHEFPGPLANH